MQDIEDTTITAQLPESKTSLIEEKSNNPWFKNINWMAVVATIRLLIGK